MELVILYFLFYTLYEKSQLVIVIRLKG